jgi:hypothetical protein
MPKEPLTERYERLSKQFAEKWNEVLEELTEKINKQLSESIKRELDAVEDALGKGDIASAYYHKMIAEILLSSVLPKTY